MVSYYRKKRSVIQYRLGISGQHIKDVAFLIFKVFFFMRGRNSVDKIEKKKKKKITMVVAFRSRSVTVTAACEMTLSEKPS